VKTINGKSKPDVLILSILCQRFNWSIDLSIHD